MAVQLTASGAEQITCSTGITNDDVKAAETIIGWRTGYTPTEHADTRGVPASMVRQAWAIVAARIGEGVKALEGDAVTSEVQGDYQYQADLSKMDTWRVDPLAGLPRTLLGVQHATLAATRPGMGSSSTAWQWR